MTRWRRQLPVYSPLSARVLAAGIRAIAAPNGDAAQFAARVVALLKARYGARAVFLTDGGTGALTAALLATKGPVGLPAYSCYDVATAAEGANVQALLYDLDPRRLAPDLAQIETALNRGARAIVVAHLYGHPVDLTDVNRLAAAAGAIVIEDAAQAVGATVNGRLAGSQASLGVLSFGRGKGLTGGGGGALLAFDETGERLVRDIRTQVQLGKERRGWTELAALAAQWLFQRPDLYAIPAALPQLRLGQTVYRPPRPLRGPARVTTSMIAASWPLADQETQIRCANAERLLVELRRHAAFQTMIEPMGARAGYLRLPVLGSLTARGAIHESRARTLGIMPGYPQPLCELESFGRRCLNRHDHFPGSRLLAARLCTFPTHGRLQTSDLKGLAEWIRQCGTR